LRPTSFDHDPDMNKATLLKRLMQLTPTERLDIAEQLWDSVHPPGSIRPGEEFVLTDEQKAELDRRIAEHERDPSSAIPWEVVRARLRAKYS
jgi:putative addiction module component (TIGR02574 family)